jgi:arylformamidase
VAIYDISLPVGPALAGWPGDAAYRLKWTTRIADGESVNLGEVAMSIHTGTHVDAPLHFRDSGPAMDAADLAAYVGRAVVVDVQGIATIRIADIEAALDATELRSVPRLLLRTGAWTDHTRFPDSIPVLDGDVPGWLGAHGVRLLGLDVPSVDALDSKDLPIHHALGRQSIAILESLNLSAVAPGVYELIALPLRLVGADGSPVRAIVRDVASHS